MAILMDGKVQANIVKQQVKASILKITSGKPSMSVVQVGNDPASTVYIKHKEKACAEVGILFNRVSLPENISEADLLSEIDKINNDTSVHGFLIQQPLPRHINTDIVVEKINPNKDIDCLHPYNTGLVSEQRGFLLPCTPLGIINLLDAYNIDLEGKHCVIIGRSRIVGKPLGMMMLGRNATVTYCHSKTKNLSEITKQADILTVAIGQEGFLTADMIKPGCVLVDVGINRRKNNKLCGDADFESCFEKASYITPVPGGVGPMTVAMLIANGLKAWENS